MENSLSNTQTNFRIHDNKLFMVNNDNERLKKQIDELQNNILSLNTKNANLESENKNLNDNYQTLLVEQKILLMK